MADKLRKIHDEALRRFDKIQSSLREERYQCVEDRRFYSISGAQWEGKLTEQFENKPRFEFNKIHLSIMRIISEYRNNRITVDFIAKDGAENDRLADVCDGLYRADEQDSFANEAYDNAFEEAVGGGIGGWRLRACYENPDDPDDDKQRIRIEPIFDADSSIWFDLDARRQDKADASHCYVLNALTTDAYREKYKDDPTSWPKEVFFSRNFDWVTPDVVYVAEYYTVTCSPYKVYTYESISGEEEKYTEDDFEQDEDLKKRLKSTRSKLIRERTINRKRVHKYIMSGGKVLEDCGEIAGSCIPIVPVFGKRWYVENIERSMGHVRLCKDAQRLKNIQLSKLGEISALSAVEKPIVTPEQIRDHQVMWEEDNIKNYPYLLINPVTDVNGSEQPIGPVAYTKPPQVPPAMAALIQTTEADMVDMLGKMDATQNATPNMSGKAIELVQNRLDMQTFIYMSNFAKAMQRSGEVWLGMAREIYVEDKRKMKAVLPDGKPQTVELNKPILNDETGDVEYENDLSKAKYDVVASVGPSTDSKRQATVRALTMMMQMTPDPEMQQVLASTAMLNMEGEGIDDLRTYFRRKLVRLGAVKPTDQEAMEMQAEMANQGPDAQTQYLQAAAESEAAKAQKTQAETAYTMAKVEKTQAETADTQAGTIETLSEIERNELQMAKEVAGDVGININQGTNQVGAEIQPEEEINVRGIEQQELGAEGAGTPGIPEVPGIPGAPG